MLDRVLWRLWLLPRPVAWDFKVPAPVWRWWTDRLAASAFRPDIEALVMAANRRPEVTTTDP